MEILEFKDARAKEIVDDGGVMVLPTETVYGIGVRWDDAKAYEELVQAKNRRPDKPIAVMAGKSFDPGKYLEINDGIQRVIDRFLPGPFTLLIKAKENASYQSHLGTFVVGLRIPGKPELLEFLDSLAAPMQVTSANLSGEPAATTFEQAYDVFKDNPNVKGIIKGDCRSSIPTTIVNFTTAEPVLIRQGELSFEDVMKVYRGN